MREKRWSKAGSEPTLWEVLADPIVMILMKADRIARKDVLAAIAGYPEHIAPAGEKLPLSA